MWPARFSGTWGWAGETEKDGQRVHFMLYENDAEDLYGEGGNAMILPITLLSLSASKTCLMAPTSVECWRLL